MSGARTQKILTGLGAYLIASVVANIFYNAYVFDDVMEILWGCDMVGLFLGIALLARYTPMYATALVIAVPGQFFWIVDFFLELGGWGFGRTAFLKDYGVIDFILTLNLHAIIIPIALYAVIVSGFSKRSGWMAIAVIIILFSFTFVTTDIDDNINCVFYGCDQQFSGSWIKADYLNYFLIEFLLFWTVIMGVSYAVGRQVFKDSLVA